MAANRLRFVPSDATNKSSGIFETWRSMSAYPTRACLVVEYSPLRRPPRSAEAGVVTSPANEVVTTTWAGWW